MSGGSPRSDSGWGSEGLDPELVASRARLFASVGSVRRLVSPASPRWNPSAETLHELHRALRKLRVELRPWRDSLRGGRRGVLRAADRDLQEVGRLVGEVRDRDVARGVLERLAHRHAMLELGGLSRIDRALAAEGRSGRTLLPRAVGGLREGGALDAIEAVARAPPSPAESFRWSGYVRTWEEVLLAGVRRRFARARRGRSADRLHQLRQSLRAARLWSETYTLPTVAWFPEPLAELQSELGAVHDVWVTRELLLRLPPSSRARTWVGPIQARFETRCRNVRRTLDAEPTVTALHRLVGDLPDSAAWSPIAPPEVLVRTRSGAWT